MPFCQKCNQEVSIYDTFCHKCGTKLAHKNNYIQPEDLHTATPTRQKNPSQNQKKSTSRSLTFIYYVLWMYLCYFLATQGISFVNWQFWVIVLLAGAINIVDYVRTLRKFSKDKND